MIYASTYKSTRRGIGAIRIVMAVVAATLAGCGPSPHGDFVDLVDAARSNVVAKNVQNGRIIWQTAGGYHDSQGHKYVCGRVQFEGADGRAPEFTYVQTDTIFMMDDDWESFRSTWDLFCDDWQQSIQMEP